MKKSRMVNITGPKVFSLYFGIPKVKKVKKKLVLFYPRNELQFYKNSHS